MLFCIENVNNGFPQEPLIRDTTGIHCLFTFSKFYSLPQLQLSFSISSFEMNNMIEDFLNYPISSLKEEIGLIALDDNKRNLESFNFL